MVPVGGALVSRYKWWQFRRRFDELRLRPLLDYQIYRQIGGGAASGGGAAFGSGGETFRFIGGFESVTDGRTLWIQGENLTIPVSLTNAQTWLLPMREGEYMPEAFEPGEEVPERIRWDRVSTLTEGARVFVGGALLFQDERWCFVSTREMPLIVIFYDCPDSALTPRAIRAGRYGNEYWNPITPYSLVIGALCQIFIAVSFLPRPAFRLTVITALIALFVPLFPVIPPGLLFTVLYHRLSWRARILRAYRDLARLPLRYLLPEKTGGRQGFPESSTGDLLPETKLPDGEIYGYVTRASLPECAREGKIPFLLPEYSKEGMNAEWHIFGALRAGAELPVRPEDPFATFGILPGKPDPLARRLAITAYTLEAVAVLTLLAGIGLNFFFIMMILRLL